MIINFSIRNFKSVKETQTLSFEADSSDILEDAFVIRRAGHRLLKLALIYGANASGKTTILQALDFLRELVLFPAEKKMQTLNFEPYLFDKNTPKQSSELSISFLQNEIKYYYRAEFTKQAIITEELYFYNPRKALVFERTTNLDKELTELNFGSKISIDAASVKYLKANTLWNNTVLGGFEKTNINIPAIQEVVQWFKLYLKPMVDSKTHLYAFISEQIKAGVINKSDVIKILRQADLNISDIRYKVKEDEIPDTLFEILKTQFINAGKDPAELEKNRKVKVDLIEFVHTVNNTSYVLPFEAESQGTRRYYSFSGLLALLIKESTLIPIDELEASLHPDLFLHFMLSFLLNSKNSQLLATTHNRELLNNKNIFRNDAIWFTDCSKNDATELYSLADFPSEVVRDTSNVLNAYKSGRLGATPFLSDNYIDLENG